MAIQKRHRGTLGDFGDLGAPDLSFSEPDTPKEPEVKPAPAPKAEPAPQQAPVAPAVEAPAPTAPVVEAPAPVAPAPAAPVVETPVAQAPVTETPITETPAEVEEEKPRRGRPKGIKGAGPKRLNLIEGDKDKVLALQLPSKLIDGLRRYADDHNITMKELIGKALMKKIGPEYYK